MKFSREAQGKKEEPKGTWKIKDTYNVEWGQLSFIHTECVLRSRSDAIFRLEVSKETFLG